MHRGYAPSKRRKQDGRYCQRLDLFAARCRQMAERIRAGEVPFLWGIDVLEDAAIASGLADDVGDDVIQAVMAAAFLGCRS